MIANAGTGRVCVSRPFSRICTSGGQFVVDERRGFTLIELLAVIAIDVCHMDASVSKTRLKRLWDLRWHKEYTLSDPLPPWPAWMANLPE
jgi:hypothetical protein